MGKFAIVRLNNSLSPAGDRHRKSNKTLPAPNFSRVSNNCPISKKLKPHQIINFARQLSKRSYRKMQLLET